MKRIGWLSLLLSLAATLYVIAIRPWHLRWGATDTEIRQALPGDEIVPQPKHRTTHAITINAQSEVVWSWLIQLGQGRGGFYTYDWLENLLGLNIHSANEIDPELQVVNVGDFIAAAPDDAAGWIVTKVEPPRELVLRVVNPNSAVHDGADPSSESMTGVWSFVVVPLDSQTCRLIVRWQSDWLPNPGMTVLMRLFVEPAHFIMERGMLQGIKSRAERRS